MAKYRVLGTVKCTVGMEIDAAESADEAMMLAESEFGGIMAFAGNGGMDKLIGVAGEAEFIECDDLPEWDYASIAEED